MLFIDIKNVNKFLTTKKFSAIILAIESNEEEE